MLSGDAPRAAYGAADRDAADRRRSRHGDVRTAAERVAARPRRPSVVGSADDARRRRDGVRDHDRPPAPRRPDHHRADAAPGAPRPARRPAAGAGARDPPRRPAGPGRRVAVRRGGDAHRPWELDLFDHGRGLAAERARRRRRPADLRTRGSARRPPGRRATMPRRPWSASPACMPSSCATGRRPTRCQPPVGCARPRPGASRAERWRCWPKRR